MTNYQKAKSLLLSISKEAKDSLGSDKPAIRQVINDSCDQICRGYIGYGNLTEHQKNLLANYVCKLHPKN